MRRLWRSLLAGLIAATACSTSDDTAAPGPGDVSTEAETVSIDVSPVGTFCSRWTAFSELMDSEAEPNDELVQEVLDQQASVDAVIPDELRPAWNAIVDWNKAFIAFFGRAGYKDVTEELFVEIFGGETEAGQAQEAMENGYGTIRGWVERNCSDGGGSLAFCEAWDDMTALAAVADETPSAEVVEDLGAAIDDVGVVPSDVQDEWATWVSSFNLFREVLATVSYDPDRINEAILTQAFGSVEAASATEEAADRAEAAINEWAVIGCGDFCGRWSELRQALDETGDYIGWVREDVENGPARLEQHLRAFDIGNALVPGDIRGAWEHAVQSRLDWVGWWESFDFDPGQLESQNARDRALEIMQDASSLLVDRRFADDVVLSDEQRRVVAAWQEGATEVPSWLLTGGTELDDDEVSSISAWLEGREEAPDWLWEYWRMGPVQRVGYQVTSAMDGWVVDNCEVRTGQPGTIRVRYPRIQGAAGDALVVAVMASGAGIEDLAEPEAILAGTCAGIGSDPWGSWIDPEGNEERWESESFRAERWHENSLCSYQWDQDPVRLDAGAYTMVAAVMDAGLREGNLGDPSVTPTPTACVAFDIRIDGDTVVDLPDLPPCDMDIGATADPWRDPPVVDPSTPGAGSLHIEIPSLVLPEEIGGREGGELLIIVLPGGTTLNEVGRQQVWPSGAIHTWLASPGTPDAQELERRGAVRLPVAELSAGGSPRSLDTHWLASNPPVDRLPLAVLAPGLYDVRVQINVAQEEALSRCSTFEVTIDGDTVVALPELEECPSWF